MVSVPILARGLGRSLLPVTQFIRKSLYQTLDWENALLNLAQERGLDGAQILSETFSNPIAEGVYIKVEQNGKTVDRLKWVDHTFLNSIMDSGTHWLNRPIIPNLLAPEIDIFSGV